MIEYTLGFVFSEDLIDVLLIKKSRPEYQKGKFNGLGGKLNDNEVPLDGMIREFKEESGVDFNGFRKFGTIKGDEFTIHLFTGVTNDIYLHKKKTDEGNLWEVEVNRLDRYKIMPNLAWLVPLAKECLSNNSEMEFIIRE